MSDDAANPVELPPGVREALHRVWQFPALRPGQDEVVAAVLDGADVLAVMPTGAGKSLCYQLPAVVSGTLTVVVSPLIALMRDQVRQLAARGVAAGALHSGLDGAAQGDVERALRERRLRLLYVSPERLLRPGTIDRLRAGGCDRLAIDEAHCVSQWGHDFRPEYMELHAAADSLGNPQMIAVTASADPGTRDEIAARLFRREPRRFVRSFDRPNLYLAVRRKGDAARQVGEFVRAHKGQSGIVYCASRKGTERLADQLAGAGVQAVPYHAGMDAHLRHANQDTFVNGTGVVVVATIAFGMGIDKPDVRFVCHTDLPGSVEAYYQEIGRAGRDGARADTLLLWGEGDIRLRERQIAQADAPAARKRIDRQRLSALLAFCESPRCRRQTLLRTFGEAIGPCGFCDVCQGAYPAFDGVVAAQKAMSALLRTSGRFFPGHLVNILIGSATEAVRRHGHQDLPTFGVGAEFGAAGWRSIYRQIEAARLIEQDAADDRWFVTEDGRAVLAGEQSLTLLSATERATSRRGAAATDAGDDEPLTVADSQLFAALKASRLALARARKVPAYVICPDRSLREVARTRPRDMPSLAAIRGIGASRAQTYGADLLATISRHGD